MNILIYFGEVSDEVIEFLGKYCIHYIIGCMLVVFISFNFWEWTTLDVCKPRELRGASLYEIFKYNINGLHLLFTMLISHITKLKII